MKRLLILFVVSLLASHFSTSRAQGIPFLRNYSASDYHAHNRNFDIETAKDGTVFVANFEGLLYYDRVEWRMLHTPGITRVTVVYRDRYDIVWVGGYNYFGKIKQKPNGDLYLQRIGGKSLFRGEVQEIWEKDGDLLFFVNDGKVYRVKNDEVTVKMTISEEQLNFGLSDIIETQSLDQKKVVVLEDVTHTEHLEKGLNVLVKKGFGLIFFNDADKELYSINSQNGLCNDNVIYVSYNGHNELWGATDDGIFAISVPTVYSRFTAHEGLNGEVFCIDDMNGRKYVGTNSGLYRQDGMKFTRLPEINHACWDLAKTQDGLLAATANGVFHVTRDGTVRQLTNTNSTALLDVGSFFYSGEMDGVYSIQKVGNVRKKECDFRKVNKMIVDKEGTVWLENLYGEVWSKKTSDEQFKPNRISISEETAATIVQLESGLEIVKAESEKPFPYPLYSYLDDEGVTWLTDNEGKSLYRWKNGRLNDNMEKLLSPFSDLSVQALYYNDGELWIGGDYGVYIVNIKNLDIDTMKQSQLLFRSVKLNGDSVLWGGYGQMPRSLPELKNGENNLRFTYALDYEPMVGKTLYRYRVNGGNWSAWADDRDAEFLNLSHGTYTIEIQAQTPDGNLSDIVSMDFSIAAPFYVKWYMNLLYLVLGGVLVYALFRYRLHRLNLEKQKLESIVQERTADLRNAQKELIRQEKMATVGKLTQGLIDRILNPLNYINNFSKLSEGLVKDLEANIEGDKDNMDSENYEDTIDVLGMLRGNLQKVSEHGQNTTRTLKAMEEMLKDRSGGIVPMDLVTVLRQDEEMLNTYFANDIRQYGIKTAFYVPQATIKMNGNADQLSKTLMSILGNAVYAVVKKAQRENYKPEITVSVSEGKSGYVDLAVRDNGIGIEPTIIHKIFDPFFTTKTTGEAAGVGLYLSHEIIQNHGGTITVNSEKDAYTEFIITLPIS